MAKGFTALRKASSATKRAPVKKSAKPKTAGHWLAGVAMGPAGARRYKLYRPAGLKAGERVPMIVMLHGCGQDAEAFAASTRMNQIAARERFVVLYPEQDRLANAQGCWNWFETQSRRAFSEAALLMAAVEQACLLYPVDRQRIALAGFSAGASMATLMATQYPQAFQAVAMHSGVPPGMAHSTLTALRAMQGRRAVAQLPAQLAAGVSSWPPLLVIHGQADAVVNMRNAHAAAQVWADAGAAKATAARSVQRGQRYPMTVTDFKHRGSTVATLVMVERLGHAWSGGAASQPFSDAKGPDASRMIWAFVAKQFRD